MNQPLLLNGPRVPDQLEGLALLPRPSWLVGPFSSAFGPVPCLCLYPLKDCELCLSDLCSHPLFVASWITSDTPVPDSHSNFFTLCCKPSQYTLKVLPNQQGITKLGWNIVVPKTWLCLEIPSVKISNRTGNKGQPRQNLTCTRNSNANQTPALVIQRPNSP